jgi:hypothetical protein
MLLLFVVYITYKESSFIEESSGAVGNPAGYHRLPRSNIHPKSGFPGKYVVVSRLKAITAVVS